MDADDKMLRCKYAARKWWGIFFTNLLEPIRDRSAFLQFLAFPFIIFVFFSRDGLSKAVDEAVNTITTLEAFLYAIPVYALFCALIALFKTPKAIRNIGTWHGNRFIYNEPIRVETTIISATNDNMNKRFKVIDALPNSFASFIMEYHGGLGYLEIKPHENQSPMANGRGGQYGVRLNNKQETVAHLHCPKGSVETVAIIRMVYWEK